MKRPNSNRGCIAPVLTEPQVAFIKAVLIVDKRQRANVGIRRRTFGVMRRLAERFGVSEETIKSIAKGVRWKHVIPAKWYKRYLRNIAPPKERPLSPLKLRPRGRKRLLQQLSRSSTSSARR